MNAISSLTYKHVGGLLVSLNAAFALHIANFVAWLCTDNPRIRNGADFEVHGPRIGVMTHLGVSRTLVQPGGWSIADMSLQADILADDSTNSSAAQ